MVRSLPCALGVLLDKLQTRSVAKEAPGEYPAPKEGLLTEMHKVKSLYLLELQEEGAVRGTSPEILSGLRWKVLPGPGAVAGELQYLRS